MIARFEQRLSRLEDPARATGVACTCPPHPRVVFCGDLPSNSERCPVLYPSRSGPRHCHDAQCGQRSRGASGVCYVETKSSLWQAGHLTNFGSSSSNHERPHSQRILYTCCTVTVPHFSSWTSIPLAVAPCDGAPFRPTRRPSGGNLLACEVRSFATCFMTKSLLSVSHACSRGRAVRGRSHVLILDGPEQLESR